MKKRYQKPIVWIENFVLSEIIAAGTDGCGVKADMWDDAACDTSNPGLLDWWNKGLFLAEGNCNEGITQEDYDAVCLHTATAMFSS